MLEVVILELRKISFKDKFELFFRIMSIVYLSNENFERVEYFRQCTSHNEVLYDGCRQVRSRVIVHIITDKYI